MSSSLADLSLSSMISFVLTLLMNLPCLIGLFVTGAAFLGGGRPTTEQSVRNMFNFSASEKVLKDFKGRYTYIDSEDGKVRSTA